MERRDFCRILGCAAFLTCTAGTTGCARLLEWSAGYERGAVELTMRGSTDTRTVETTTSAATTRSAEGTGAAEPSLTTPDLAVRAHDDPATATRAAVAALGGMEAFVGRGGRVVIKPNVLTAREPQYAVTTHPDVVAALITMAYEAGASDVLVLDRPTAPARTAFQTSGILDATERAGGSVKFLVDRNYERVTIPQGRILTDWPLVTDVFEADTFINVPIAKTHGLARLTMSMKNLMGIMGGSRGLIHQQFHEKIVDLNTLVRPHLVVLDATRILVANGPSGGSLDDVRTPRKVVAGTNQASVDAYGATLFGMRPTDLPYLVNASRRGIGEIDLARLRVDEAEA